MRQTHFWFCGLAALLWVGSGCKRPEDYLERGKRAAARGDQAEAVLDFRKAIQQNPQYVEAFRQLADSQAKRGDLARALASEERAFQLRPDDNAIRVEVADAALALYLANPQRPQAQYDEVTKLAGELLTKNPSSFDGLRFQGSLLYTDNRIPEAVALFQKANAIRPMVPGLVMPLADALWKNGQIMDAESMALALVRAHKDYLPIYDWLVLFYQTNQRPAQVETILAQKVANNPSSSFAILQLASFYQQENKTSEMVATLDQLIQRPKDFPNRFILVGDFYGRIGNWGEAGRWYNQGIHDDSANAQVYRVRLVAVYINQNKRKEALDLLGQLIQALPDEWALRAQRAEIWIMGKDKNELLKAIDALQALVKKRPRDPRLRFLLGRAYFQKGDRDLAGQSFAQAAALQRAFLEPRIALAGLDRDQQNYKETVRLADEILAIDPANFAGRLLHASGSRGLGNLDIALRELELLAKEAPQSTDVQLEIGLVTLARKQYAVAERMFSSLYQSSKSDVRALAGLTAVYLAEGQTDKAMQTVTQEVGRTPDSLELRELLAATALNAGKTDIALEQYRKLTELAPDNTKYLVNLADLFREKSDYGNEVATLEKASKLAPNNAVVAGRLALAKDLSGDKRRAAGDNKRSLELAPTDARLLNNRAYFIAEDGGNLDEALEYSQAAVRKIPGSPDLLDTLAWVYTKRKMNDSAIEILSKLVRQNPDRSSFHYHLGTALAQKGDKTGAKSELTMALTKKPAPDEEEKIKTLMDKLR